MALFQPGGNLETAFALPAIYSNARPPSDLPESAGRPVIRGWRAGWNTTRHRRWIIRGVESVLIESSQVPAKPVSLQDRALTPPVLTAM